MTTKPSTRPSNLREKSQLMSASEIERTLVRLVHEIIEKNNGAADLGLVGIKRRGVPLAQRLGEMIARNEKTPVPVGTLDIGRKVQTTDREIIEVKLREVDNAEKVLLVERQD